jgi:hypothetical protein
MPELSPAAQAVDDAFWKIINDKWNIYDRRRAQLAAALRAAADQLGYCMGLDEGDEHLVVDVDDLLAIATEIDPR